MRTITGTFPLIPMAGSSIFGLMNTRAPREHGASRAGRVALHALAAVVL